MIFPIKKLNYENKFNLIYNIEIKNHSDVKFIRSVHKKIKQSQQYTKC